MRSERKRRPVYTDSDFYTDDNKDNSSDEEYYNKKEKKSKKGRSKRAMASPDRSRSGLGDDPVPTKRNGPIVIKQRTYTDQSELERDPCGEPCRFVPFEELRKMILVPEKVFDKDEKGVTTLLPNFRPDDPFHIHWFGFEGVIETTELSTISALSDEALMKELERVEDEIAALPEMSPLEDLEDASVVAIPGYATDLTDSIAIQADVRTFDWKGLGAIQKFDVILMDPPWVICNSNVTRGVHIIYNQLEVNLIADMPLHYIQTDGYVFMWVIASQFANGVMMMKKWGYKIVATLNWIKISRYGKYCPSHGYYVQHNKETLIIGVKGNPPAEMDHEAFESCLVQQRGVRQSHKPTELYEMIEKMFPGMMYLEIFARPHNLRSGWVSLGIELPT